MNMFFDSQNGLMFVGKLQCFGEFFHAQIHIFVLKWHQLKFKVNVVVCCRDASRAGLNLLFALFASLF